MLFSLEIPIQTPLKGVEERRARTIMRLAATLEDGESLPTLVVLKRLGFSQPRGSPMPAHGRDFGEEAKGEPSRRATVRKRGVDGEVSFPWASDSPGFHIFTRYLH